MNYDEKVKLAAQIGAHINGTMHSHIMAGHVPNDWTAAQFWLWALLLIQAQQAESMRDRRTTRVREFYRIFLTKFLDRRFR